LPTMRTGLLQCVKWERFLRNGSLFGWDPEIEWTNLSLIDSAALRYGGARKRGHKAEFLDPQSDPCSLHRDSAACAEFCFCPASGSVRLLSAVVRRIRKFANLSSKWCVVAYVCRSFGLTSLLRLSSSLRLVTGWPQNRAQLPRAEPQLFLASHSVLTLRPARAPLRKIVPQFVSIRHSRALKIAILNRADAAGAISARGKIKQTEPEVPPSNPLLLPPTKISCNDPT
jgi:hypothetical protein